MSLNGQLERASVCFAVGSLLDWGVQSQKKAQAGGGGVTLARTRGAKAPGACAVAGRLRDCPVQRGPPGGRWPKEGEFCGPQTAVLRK